MEKKVIETCIGYVKEHGKLLKQFEQAKIEYERYVNDFDEETEAVVSAISHVLAMAQNVVNTTIYFTDIISINKNVEVKLNYHAISVSVSFPVEYLENIPTEKFSVKILKTERV